MSSRYQAGIVLPGYNALLVPDAPTIGTATGGNASASVTFTAPANVGGGAITGYSIVSTPGGLIGTGASSPITVSGLSNGTAYTFKVFATNAYGPSALSAASNSVTPSSAPGAIGIAYGGGYYAGQISTSGNSVADYNLVVGPVSSAQSTLKWKTVATGTTGTASVINGPTNTSNMNNILHPAAQFCVAVSAGGYSDWYMPAQNELEVCYYNLKPGTQPNNTGVGTNSNAVPARTSNYTSGNPPTTSATNFISGGAEAFTTLGYWSSTEFASYVGNAWLQSFNTGNQYSYGKNFSYRVRAIRRVAV
jgi:hypothetical protein